ncbi:MAG: hypothetical protein M1839_004683 [Geoglossum umbratile]|nr:MAG: hypothetical protein M1839_004683 [Geoglossum umbratile]
MRRDCFLVALFSCVAPVLTTAATCPCWDGVIQDIQASELVADGLCNNPSLVAQRLEECINRERCTSVAVREQEHRLAELCGTGRGNVGLRWAKGLRRRDDQPDPPDATDAPSIVIVIKDPGTTTEATSTNTKKNTGKPTPTPTKTTSKPSPTTTTKSSSTTSSTTESSTSTSTSTETSTTATTTSSTSSASSTTPTSSSTAPAASATQTSTPSGSGMGPASIAAASVFGAFAVGCIIFLAFVCTRRIKRNRDAHKKESMNEQLLGGGIKSSHRSTSGSSRSMHDTDSMFAGRNDPAANIPLTDRQTGYRGVYPPANNSYQQAPQYDPRDAYNPDGDYGDIGQHRSPYATYTPPYSASHSPAPEQYQGYRSTSATYADQNQNWAAAPIAPIRNMRSASTNSSHLNLPSALTPGEYQGGYPPSEYATGGYAPQYPTTASRSRPGS